MLIRYIAMPTERARAHQAGAVDAYGLRPERRISDGDGVPCRHCLKNVPRGKEYLILSYRPFDTLQPYAETGPVFLCAEACERAPETDVLPEMFRATPDYIVRGYDHDERIVYGTGAVIATHRICARAHELLAREDVAYLHMRSARNNCYQLRIERAAVTQA
ncbi:DUF1203 domain-containing protein [Mesorhizobium xinjiangense]|uniref:DUF1203 domain-containing protein n=1 Tax=Mesorhizobium xinjiangense TaxID=2678685 RepID=UPI0012EE654B|nr:DUF1203 domain-containing protein [Mesorhizobium xinjiangense]